MYVCIKSPEMNTFKRNTLIFGRQFIFLFSISAIFISSCKRDEEKVGWESNILTPLLKSSLSINDILSDTLLQTESDNSVKVVYENHLYKMSLDSLFEIPDTSVIKSYNLDSISLYTTSVSYPVTLGQICLNSGIVGAIIISQNGNTAVIPAIPAITSAPFVINVDTLFQIMTLVSGFIDISIHNGLPIDITNLSFELRNTSNGSLIGTCTFPPIVAGTTETQQIDLAGKTVEGNMTAQILSMDSPGSNGMPVLVDTSNTLLATLSIHNLHPSTATAIFPAQDLINKSQPFRLHLDPVQLKEAKLKSGNVVMTLYSTLQDSVHFTYSLPSATRNGVPFSIVKTLPPAPSGGPASHATFIYDFSDYHLDLSGPNNDTINDMYNSFVASIDSTGQMKTISLTDSFYANLGFIDLIPSYGRGFLGQQTFAIGPSELGIDIFKNFSGTLNLEDVKLSIVAENGIGVDGRVDINSLKSVHSNPPSQTIPLSGSAVSNPIFISRATDNGGQPPVNISITSLLLDKNNSNAPAFISNLPDKLTYSLALQTNPAGNNNLYNDFIYADYLMEFNVNVEMPLSLQADKLVLSSLIDTFSVGEKDVSRIKE